ncbi:MAG: hypothetical protein HYX67_09960 [Candidatus Melainabacteria bacterium]|nr:hypothetical protein [Candidatus Melainabacteria bacterium]
MNSKFDKDEFVRALHSQKDYVAPLESGQYLGFYLPGENVVMRKVLSAAQNEAPNVVSRTVSQLFEQDY